MQKFKALILLLLFCGYTVESFATVHQCGSEITDIDFVSIADCQHENEKVESDCSKHCCHDDSENSKELDKDCCSTSKLSSHSVDVLVQSLDKSDQIDSVHPNLSALYYSTFATNSPPSFEGYVPPLIQRDILLEVQCFRI